MHQANKEIALFVEHACQHDNFIHYCGIKPVKVEHGHITLSMDITDSLTNGYSTAHGGALASLIDTCIGLTCFAYGKKVVTLDMTINYIKGVPLSEKAFATSTMLHIGHKTMIGEAVITNAVGQIYAKGTASFFVVGDNDKLVCHW